MLLANTNTNEDNLQQHESSIRQLKTNYLRMKSNQTTPEEIQRQLYFTRKLNKLFIEEQDLPTLTDRTCRLFYNTGEFRFIWIVLLNKDQEYEYFKSEGVFENFEGIENLYRQKKIPALAQDAIQNQTIKIITSPQENCPITIDFNQHTLLIAPLVSDQQVYGVAGAAIANTSTWCDNNFELFTESIADLSYAISKIRQRHDYTLMFQEAQDGMISLDSKLNILNANLAFCQILELPKEEIIGQNAIELSQKLLVGESLNKILNKANQLMEGYESDPVEIELNDKILWVDTNFKGLSQSRIAIVRDITKRVKGERAIREREQKFREMINSLPISVFILQDGIIKYANPILCRISEYPNEELIGKNFIDFVAPSERDKVIQYYQRRSLGETTNNTYESIAQTRTGKQIPVEVTTIVVEYEQKPALQIVLVDISNFKDALRSVIESEERHRFFTTSAFEGIVIHKNGIIIDCNESITRMTGYSKEELIGNNLIIAAASEKDRDKIMTNMIQHQDKPYVIHARKKDGSLYYAEIESKDVRNRGDQVRITSIRDVTERQKLQEEVAEGKQRLETLMGNLPGLAYTCQNNANWNMNYLSAGCLELLEYEPQELIGNPGLCYNDLIFAEDRQYVWDTIQEAIQSGIPFEIEYRIRTKSGKQKWVWEKGKLAKANHSEMLEGFISDITERYEAREKINNANKELNRAQYIANIGNWSVNFSSGEITASKQAREIFGFEKDEPITIGMIESTYLPQQHERLREEFEKLLQGETKFHVDFQIRHRKDQSIRYIDSLGEYDHTTQVLTGVIQDISQQKHYEEALKKSESKFRALFEGINDAVLVHPYQEEGFGNFIEVNDIAVQRYGYTREELMSLSPKEISSLEEATKHATRESRKKLLETKFTLIETVHRTKDGKLIPIEVNSRLFEMDGKLVILSLARDITERKEAEAKLKESEERHRALYTNAPLAFQSLDHEGKLIDVNPMWLKTLGYQQEEVIGQWFGDFLAPEFVPHFRTNFAAFKKRGYVHDVQFQMVKKDGTLMYVSFEGCIGYHPDGSVKQTYCTFKDITEQRKASEALANSEERYRNLFNHSPISLWEEDCSELLEYLDELKSDGVTDFDTYTKEHPEAIATCIRKIKVIDVNPGTISMHQANDKKTLLEGIERFFTPRATEVFRDWVIRIANGQTDLEAESEAKTLSGDIRNTLMKLRVDPAAGTAILAVMDITEKKKIELELKKYQEHLEQLVKQRTEALESSNKELEAFTFSVSHDLRTPLRAIDGFAGYLEQDYSDKLNDEGKRYLQVIRDNTTKMNQLITDLLTLSRTSRAELDYIELNMKALALSMYMEVATEQEQTDFEFIVHELPTVKGDLTSIKQLWTNLIGNAVKYSSKSTIKKIEIGCAENTSDAAVYYVKDWGTGFNPEYKSKMFDIFQRLHKESDFPGSGVGLAIAKRVIDKHNGSIWVEGEIDQGATFYFSLPK